MSGGLLVNCSVWGSNQLIAHRISTGLPFKRRHEMKCKLGSYGTLSEPIVHLTRELLLLPVSYLQLRHFKYKDQEMCWRKIWVKTRNWKLPNQPAQTQLSWCRSLCTVPHKFPEVLHVPCDTGLTWLTLLNAVVNVCTKSCVNTRVQATAAPEEL